MIIGAIELGQVTQKSCNQFVFFVLQTHTFQCVLATNEVESFMIFLYADETIQQPKNDSIDGSGGLGEFSGLGDFSGDGSGDRSSDGSGSGEEIEAVAGFDTDDYYYNIPGSATAQIGNIAQTSNVGIPGMWIFNSASMLTLQVYYIWLYADTWNILPCTVCKMEIFFQNIV